MATQQRSLLYVWRCAALLALVFLVASTPLSADTAHLIIVGTNDLHGALTPRRQSDGTQQGGLALLAGFVDVLRRENPGRVIWLDGGDDFQGSIESNTTEGAPVVRALNVAGVTAAAIGNHEFASGRRGRMTAPAIRVARSWPGCAKRTTPFLAQTSFSNRRGAHRSATSRDQLFEQSMEFASGS